MQKKFKQILFVGFISVILIFLALGHFTQNALDDEEAYITSLYYDHEIITALKDILISLQRAESNRRGYVITKDLEYVRNYNASVEEVNQALIRLRSVGAMGIYHEKFLDDLEGKVQDRISSIKSSLQLFIAHSSTDSAQIAFTDKGKDLMGSIRGTILELLVERSNARDESYHSIGEIRNGMKFYYEAALSAIIAMLSALSLMTYLYFRRLKIVDEALERELFQTREQVRHATARYEKLLDKSSPGLDQTGKDE
jgi:CHASE3 domain sensor protein